MTTSRRSIAHNFRLPRGWSLGVAATLANDGSWQITQKNGTAHLVGLSVHLVKVAGRPNMLGVIFGPVALHAVLFEPGGSVPAERAASGEEDAARP